MGRDLQETEQAGLGPMIMFTLSISIITLQALSYTRTLPNHIHQGPAELN